MCAPGWDHLGGSSWTTVCAQARPSAVINLTRNVKGQIHPDDVPDEAQICPTGWGYLGGSSYDAVCVEP